MSRRLAAVPHTAIAGAGWSGPDIDPATGRLLSVEELQQALRSAHQLARDRASGTVVATKPGAVPAHRPATEMPAAGAGRWVTVLAAHGGAGASTVALALAEAAAAAGGSVHLIDTAGGALSGLVAAASAELGTDASRHWRRGSRGLVTIDRLEKEPAEVRWPVPAAGALPDLTVVDLGPARGAAFLQAPVHGDGSDGQLVVVGRLTVPGVRLIERTLQALPAGPVVTVVVVGEQRWPGPVRTSLGPLLTAVRDAGRVLTMPIDRHLELSGLNAGPLPKPMRAIGDDLRRLIYAAIPAA